MKLLFIVGKETDIYPLKYNSAQSPKWLTSKWRDYSKYVDKDDKEVPSDVAMAIYIASKYPNSVVDCIFGTQVTSNIILDRYDVVFVINDYTEVFNCGGKKKTCPKKSQMLEDALFNTKAFVFPYPSYHKYILDKPQYYTSLQNANIPVVPFFRSTPQDVLKSIPDFREKVVTNGWKGIIIKPTLAGYSIGIKVYANFSKVSNIQLKKQFEKMKKYGYPSFTVAEFVPSFGKHFEIRTYWINKRYAYSVATLTAVVDDGTEGLEVDDTTTFESEGGKLSDEIKAKLQTLGRQVIKAIPQYDYGQPFMRIDFGCCIKASSRCSDNYFVNEVESLPANMLADYTDFPVVEKTAEALYKFAKKVKDKKNDPIPSKSVYTRKQNACIYPRNQKKKTKKK